MAVSSVHFNCSDTFFSPRSGQQISVLQSELRFEPVQRVISEPQSFSGEGEQTEDPVLLSQEGIALSQQVDDMIAFGEKRSVEQDLLDVEEQDSQGEQDKAQNSNMTMAGAQLTAEEEQMVRELKQRDRQVRAHEAAHMAVVGRYAAGGPTYTYQQGPDGRQYAVGGEVPIDVTSEESPEETIEKMQAIRRAAMAPAEPSDADRSVAANAMVKENRARTELRNEENVSKREGREETDDLEQNGNIASESASLAAVTEKRQERVAIDLIA